ncbi:GPI inositol-deacylase isoform X2 [Megalopta genalis]|uniref:GPI inositol-deacylase isoform X2 n=1 Tax=Megalopta genalis TaxID=115081 RepID=UPI003FD4965D
MNRISLDNEIEERYPRYGLYAYGEGFVTEKHRRMYFSGIPVLFIPGNAGSHEQVRSLASVSLRKSLKERTPFHFDYFTVSLGKDYSALYGGVLMDETFYVSHCIQKILSLYKSSVENVILIGHSMASVIAKGSVLLSSNTNTSVTNIIITLATPHMPTLILDRTFANYYYNLENRLNEIKDAGISIISIGGGSRDTLVTTTQLLDPTADINVLSTSIPDVWKSTDHLSILWCKQLVLAIVCSLFDSVSVSHRPPRISSNSEERMQALKYHFHHRIYGKRLYHSKETIQFEPGGEWIEDIRRQYTWSSKSSSRRTPIYLMIRLTGQPDELTIDTINLESKDWLFVCTASSIQGQSRVCTWGWNLSNRTLLLPDRLHRPRKIVDLNLQEVNYPGATHIVVRITPNDLDEHVLVNVDLYSHEARYVPIKRSMPLFNILFKKPQIKKSDIGHVRYYTTIDSSINVVTVELVSECKDVTHNVEAIVELCEAGSIGVSQIQFFTSIDNGPKTMKIQTDYKQFNVSPYLRLTLNPACSYMFNIQEGGIIDRISIIVRDRWYLLYTTIISLLLLLLSIRINHSREQLPTIVVTIFLSYYYGLIFECLIAMAILSAFTIGLCCSIIFLGSVAHGIAVRFLARAITFSTTWSDWLLGGLNQLPFITTIFVVSIIPATCGALAMIISVFLYFLNLTKMYEDYLEELLMASLQHFNWTRRFRSAKNDPEEHEDTRQKILNHLILFLLWCFTAIPAIPSVLVWAKNFSYDIRLTTEDPLLHQSWIILVVCSTLGWLQIPPKYQAIRSQVLASILYFIGWIILLMGAASHPQFYQYYIPPVVAGIASLITLNFITS